MLYRYTNTTNMFISLILYFIFERQIFQLQSYIVAGIHILITVCTYYGNIVIYPSRALMKSLKWPFKNFGHQIIMFILEILEKKKDYFQLFITKLFFEENIVGIGTSNNIQMLHVYLCHKNA